MLESVAHCTRMTFRDPMDAQLVLYFTVVRRRYLGLKLLGLMT